MSSSEPQRMLLHYRLVSKIDSGGMGEVYKARTPGSAAPSPSKLLPAVKQDPTPAAVSSRKHNQLLLSTIQTS